MGLWLALVGALVIAAAFGIGMRKLSAIRDYWPYGVAAQLAQAIFDQSMMDLQALSLEIEGAKEARLTEVEVARALTRFLALYSHLVMRAAFNSLEREKVDCFGGPFALAVTQLASGQTLNARAGLVELPANSIALYREMAVLGESFAEFEHVLPSDEEMPTLGTLAWEHAKEIAIAFSRGNESLQVRIQVFFYGYVKSFINSWDFAEVFRVVSGSKPAITDTARHL